MPLSESLICCCVYCSSVCLEGIEGNFQMNDVVCLLRREKGEEAAWTSAQFLDGVPCPFSYGLRAMVACVHMLSLLPFSLC